MWLIGCCIIGWGVWCWAELDCSVIWICCMVVSVESNIIPVESNVKHRLRKGWRPLQWCMCICLARLILVAMPCIRWLAVFELCSQAILATRQLWHSRNITYPCQHHILLFMLHIIKTNAGTNASCKTMIGSLGNWNMLFLEKHYHKISHNMMITWYSLRQRWPRMGHSIVSEHQYCAGIGYPW